VVALATPQLGRLAGDVTQSRQDRASGGQQAIFASCRSEFAAAWAKNKSTLHVAGNQSVVLERDSQTMRRGSSKPGGGDEARKRRRAAL
jgi:hypothetical protein